MADSLRSYVLLAAMSCRSAFQYRASLAMLTATGFVANTLDILAIALLFQSISSLGGFTAGEVAYLYGTSGLSFALADLVAGDADRVGRRVRDGSIDALLLRPVGSLVQLTAGTFAPRRLGRIVQASAVLGWSLTAVDLDWTPTRIALVLLTVVCGTVIFGSLFVLAGAFQFVAVDAAEVANAFTYGGNYLTQYPPAVFGQEMLRGLTFVVPMAFVNWQPALYVLSKPDPIGLPAMFRFGSPFVAVAAAVLAGLAWRAGIRRYQSTGS